MMWRVSGSGKTLELTRSRETVVRSWEGARLSGAFRRNMLGSGLMVFVGGVLG